MAEHSEVTPARHWSMTICPSGVKIESSMLMS
jgi:hypothetical protein